MPYIDGEWIDEEVLANDRPPTDFRPVIGGESVDPRENAVIIGYGNRLARSTANGWVAPGGAEISDEEASKIHSETIAKRNESWAAEAEATRKSNIPDKPSDDALALAAARRKFMEIASKHIDIDPEAEGQRMADATRAQMTGNVGDRVLKNEKEIHKINQIAEARGAQVRAEKERERQHELDKLSDIFAKKYAEGQEEKRHARNKEEWLLKHKMTIEEGRGGSWVIQEGDDGFLKRINKATGEVLPVLRDGKPLANKKPEPTEKEPLSVNIERVRKMYAEYIKDKDEPDATDILATKKAANTVGLDLKKVSVPDPGWLPSTKNRTKDVWQLVPKDDAEPVKEQSNEKPPAAGAKLAPDGNWYIPNPNAKGKWLRYKR